MGDCRTALLFFAGSIVWPSFLGALSVALLASGMDDFVPLLTCAWHWTYRQVRRHTTTSEAASALASERRIAILVPCWQESAVVGNMVRHNLAAIRYRNYHFFLGVYPNDEATVRVARQLASDFSNVHTAECPHPGPTSKADCLNWAFREMQYLEEEKGVPFDTVVLHDAEDLIHPQALPLINRERAQYDMVQVPVLPLPTGFSDVTHGVYIDEFSEFQTIDMRARQFSRSFVPSNGVGTGFSRTMLASLARDTNDQVFTPGSLTEDYEIGVRIHALGYRQCFAPLAKHDGDFVATREYFPRTMKAAVRQRTRWVTGIALQCWERQGWRGSWRTRYWFWRDRKGLLTNPLSVVANVLFIAGMFDWILSRLSHCPWLFEIHNPRLARLCAATMLLQGARVAIRMLCVARIFGLNTATAVPLRAFHANLMNCGAAMRAVRDYFVARRAKSVLTWQKTEHAYPAREALHRQRRKLSDVLVGCGYVSEQALCQAQAEAADEATLDLLLLANGLVSEDDLCKAISLQSGLATARVDPKAIDARAIRTLPAHLAKRHGVVPIGVASGRLLLASTGVPSEAAYDEITTVSELPVDVQLVTQSAYASLRELL